jgi:hypothetical protein
MPSPLFILVHAGADCLLHFRHQLRSTSGDTPALPDSHIIASPFHSLVTFLYGHIVTTKCKLMQNFLRTFHSAAVPTIPSFARPFVLRASTAVVYGPVGHFGLRFPRPDKLYRRHSSTRQDRRARGKYA